MNDTLFVIVAYLLSSALIWGYAWTIWVDTRRLRKRLESNELDPHTS